jgi:uncharacterized protein HemY
MSTSPIRRKILGGLQKILLKRLLKFSMRKMRDDPSVRERLQSEGKSTEGAELIFGYPDNMIDCTAEALAEAIVADPGYYREHHEVNVKLYNEILQNKKQAWKWFNSDEPAHKVTEEQMKRDGAALLCRRGKIHLESGRFSSARVFFDKACELDEKSSEAWLCLADALDGMGLTEDAERAKKRAAHG